MVQRTTTPHSKHSELGFLIAPHGTVTEWDVPPHRVAIQQAFALLPPWLTKNALILDSIPNVRPRDFIVRARGGSFMEGTHYTYPAIPRIAPSAGLV